MPRTKLSLGLHRPLQSYMPRHQRPQPHEVLCRGLGLTRHSMLSTLPGRPTKKSSMHIIPLCGACRHPPAPQPPRACACAAAGLGRPAAPAQPLPQVQRLQPWPSAAPACCFSSQPPLQPRLQGLAQARPGHWCQIWRRAAAGRPAGARRRASAAPRALHRDPRPRCASPAPRPAHFANPVGTTSLTGRH